MYGCRAMGWGKSHQINGLSRYALGIISLPTNGVIAISRSGTG